MRKIIVLFLGLFLITTCVYSEEISLPLDNIQLWKQSESFPWRFKREFGWFPDREGAWMESDLNVWILHTDKTLTNQEKQDIKDFTLDPEHFQDPVYGNLLVLHIDYEDIISKIDKYCETAEPSLNATYVGKGIKQFIFFSRELTTVEKTKLKNLIASYITFK